MIGSSRSQAHPPLTSSDERRSASHQSPSGYRLTTRVRSAAEWQAALTKRKQDEQAKQEAARLAQEVERERLQAREAEAEQRAAEARKRAADNAPPRLDGSPLRQPRKRKGAQQLHASDADRNGGFDRGKARQMKKSLDNKLSTCLAFLEDVGLFDGWVALLSYALLSRKERKWLIK
jgi:hypothetical protein